MKLKICSGTLHCKYSFSKAKREFSVRNVQYTNFAIDKDYGNADDKDEYGYAKSLVCLHSRPHVEIADYNHPTHSLCSKKCGCCGFSSSCIDLEEESTC